MGPTGPDPTGLAELRALLAGRFADRRGLVTVAYVNNEIGAVQDLRAVGQIVAAANANRPAAQRVCLHTDAVQAPGHVALGMGRDGPLELVDAVTLSAHKFHGPPGIGLVAMRSTEWITQPLMLGGEQQGGCRAGTENTAGTVAMAAALADAADPAKLSARMDAFRTMAAAV